VIYCAEQFENDGSPVSTIVKGVKRAMAGEYSREPSAKGFKGQCKLIELGFRQGGPAGYGLRRMLIDQGGRPKAQLEPGEQKSLQTDRVVLVPGPVEELAVVRRIYLRFVQDLKSEREIAEELVGDGLTAEGGRAWTRGIVHEILTNEKYVGPNVYNRVSFKLKKKRVRNPPEMWVRHDGAFDAIVESSEFAAAQALTRRSPCRARSARRGRSSARFPTGSGPIALDGPRSMGHLSPASKRSGTKPVQRWKSGARGGT